MRIVIRFAFIFITLGGLAAGCSESHRPCGDEGRSVSVAGTSVCSYSHALAQKAGFECPSQLPHRVDLMDATVCSADHLNKADLAQTCKAIGSECLPPPRSPPNGEMPDRGSISDPGYTAPKKVDAGTLDAGTATARDAAPMPRDATGPPVGTRHPQCKEPLPAELPSLPPINLTNGFPAFKEWQSISCDTAKKQASLCPEWTGSNTSPGECGSCLHGAPDDDGVCTYGDVDVWCDGEGEVIGLAPGCWICSPPEVHARACCEGLDVDCREWPFLSDSARGMICARHEDCELGLVCGAPGTGSGYGICKCPEDDPVKWNAECSQLIVPR